MHSPLLKDCVLCPRECHVDRTAGERGYCRMTAELVVARAALHHWEEPCLSGERGSGTVFFSGCALGCVYCQNHPIAEGKGKLITIDRLAEIFLELQAQGAHNINLVTPDHYVPHLIEAIRRSRRAGLALPIVYNCSGYEKVAALQLLEGLIDIYLPDLKYLSAEPADRYSQAGQYFAVAAAAIAEMVRQVGAPVFDGQGIMQKGVLVRHLTLPGRLGDSKRIIRYLHERYGERIFLSIMNQYTPCTRDPAYPELHRKVSPAAYEALVDYAIDIGVENAFIQDGEAALESFIPEFDNTGV
ncbi:MAG: radical SAM protein [Eubacteriales bacterium]